MDTKIVVKKQSYIGLFMITLATLMYEILLTRIFSVTMWYHFAFVAISVAMFGMTVGAILVYLLPGYFTQERTKHNLALSALFFSISIVLSFMTYISIPFTFNISVIDLYSIALIYVALSVPFIFSGICVCLALTKFPQQVSRLYAADLLGAASGCVLLVYTLKITDGPTSVVVIAFLAGIGTIFFAAEEGFNRLTQIAIVCSILFHFFAATNTVLVNRQRPLLTLKYVKGKIETPPIYERWNSFSRIRIFEDPNYTEEPFGWGLSSTFSPDRKIKQLRMDIDAMAATYLTAFNGNLNDVEFLKYDLINLAHYIRPNSKVLVVGTGAGRDILSALVFNQKSVLGVEINKNIITSVNQNFGDFTGHLDKNPKVTFINDEARSYITRQKDKFDIIQVSFIDTWAATAAGAFVLTENSLYTVEAWKVFLEHLTPNGVLTFSRWYSQSKPYQIYRLTSLARDSLMQLGIKNPRNHIVIVRQGFEIGTILVSKKPFTDKDLDTIEDVTCKMQFSIVLSPRDSLDPILATLASGGNIDTFLASFQVNITAPTDNSPFFFHMLRLRDLINQEQREQLMRSIEIQSVFVLGALLITIAGLTFLCIIVPLILTTDKGTLKGSLPLFIFFAAIGFGFMLIEISQMQRLIIFLGHPTYGLSVVLFSLLLSSGLGSYLTQKISNAGTKSSAILRLSLLLCSLLIFGKFTPHAISMFQNSTTVTRILIATLILFPLGLFMGMAFPLGMKVASARSSILTPWLWGINGATSVCASVIAIIIALSFGISTSFWTGFSCYFLALIALIFTNYGITKEKTS